MTNWVIQIHQNNRNGSPPQLFPPIPFSSSLLPPPQTILETQGFAGRALSPVSSNESHAGSDPLANWFCVLPLLLFFKTSFHCNGVTNRQYSCSFDLKWLVVTSCRLGASPGSSQRYPFAPWWEGVTPPSSFLFHPGIQYRSFKTPEPRDHLHPPHGSSISISVSGSFLCR